MYMYEVHPGYQSTELLIGFRDPAYDSVFVHDLVRTLESAGVRVGKGHDLVFLYIHEMDSPVGPFTLERGEWHLIWIIAEENQQAITFVDNVLQMDDRFMKLPVDVTKFKYPSADTSDAMEKCNRGSVSNRPANKREDDKRPTGLEEYFLRDCTADRQGLYASVRCNCWEKGLCKRYIHEDRICIDKENRLYLCTENGKTPGDQDEFSSWIADCCEHPNMKLVNCRIASWPRLRIIQAKLANLGEDDFPTLKRILSASPRGTVSPEDCESALGELERFAQADHDLILVARDVNTKARLFEHVPQYFGVIKKSPKYEVGIDERGYFIDEYPRKGRFEFSPSKGDKTIFSSTLFEQTVLPDGRVKLHDKRKEVIVDAFAAAGECLTLPYLTGETEKTGIGTHIAETVIVERQRIKPGEFDQELNALRAVFRRSIDSGNPLRWY